ncbi:MAG: hypothetical protein GXC73_17275 [Chitinophagaceae bacterium]|nr:hypothetical protein [Chitinophagaceae bacterium]
MKHTLLVVFTVIGLSLSCTKKSEQGYVCKNEPACGDIRCVAFWSKMHFTIADKKTGADLLFGSNASLTPADIKLYFKQNSPYQQAAFYVDNSKKELVCLATSDTMALQVKDGALQYLLVKKFCSFECCSRTAVEVVQEGTLLVADDKKLVRFRN